MASVFWGLLTISNLAAPCEQLTLLCPCVWLQVLGEGTDIPVSLEGPGTQTAGGCPDSQGREGPPPTLRGQLSLAVGTPPAPSCVPVGASRLLTRLVLVNS